MGLRSIANSDLSEIMNDVEAGGDAIIITSPSGDSLSVNAICNDVYSSIDPGTGIVVSGRVCTASVLLSDLVSSGFDSIKGIPDATSRPWLVTMADVIGRQFVGKVREVNPDSHLGLVVLHLEEYTA